MHADRARWGRRGGLALATVGLLLVAYWASDFVASAWRQHGDQARWAEAVRSAQAAGPAQPVGRPVNGVAFRLRVPRLGYDAVVREGVDLGVLASGPGHYPGSAWPGQPGTVGVAAHNVYWVRFDQLRPGDALVVDAVYGTFTYRVERTVVVMPDDTSVLRPGPSPQLTLTTCWPLWAGQFAPRRLAILATAAV